MFVCGGGFCESVFIGVGGIDVDDELFFVFV